MCDVRQFSSSIAHRVKKKKRESAHTHTGKREKQRKEKKKRRETDRFSLLFSTHFAFLHLLFSRAVLGVTAPAAAAVTDVVRRKDIDNHQQAISYCY
jgi:hypothetical protein